MHSTGNHRSRLVAAASWMLLAVLLIPGLGCRSESDSSAAIEPDPAAPESAAEIVQQSSQPLDREREIESADQLAERNDLDGAVSKLRSLLVVDPGDVEVVFRLAGLTAHSGDLAAAVELLDSIPVDHPEAGIPAVGQSADWCFELERYGEAERRYRKVLEFVPQAAEAHRKLAYLYNRQGRRHEAAPHLYQLCEQGNVRQDELHALINLSDAMYDDPSNRSAAGEMKYWPIGPAAEARRLFMENRYQEAVTQLSDAVEAGNQPASIVALYGRAAAEAQDDERLRWWLTQTDAATEQFAEYWAALGMFLLAQNRHAEAARALLEAVDRDPTDFRSIGRLRSAMETLERNDDAIRWEQRWMQLQQTTNQNNRIAESATPDTAAMVKLADMLDGLGRSLEAILWRSMAGMHQQLPREAMLELNAQLRKIVATNVGYPGRDARLCDIDLDDFPLPRIESLREMPLQRPTEVSERQPRALPARFENVADELGLQHAYQVASTRLDYGFAVYQSVGGAVAVLDYDLDGSADLYFAQGGAEPPEFVGEQSNLLYRHLGLGLMDVTEPAAATEFRYSMGVTAGDWNQDGFPDLVVANIGANSLLINNGDGTFTKTMLDDGDDKTRMSTSLAMADLTGDALPDLFELNYLHDPDISRRPRKNARGEVIESLMPQEFNPGLDRLIVNENQSPPSLHDIGEPASAARAGLGVVVCDFDHRGGNEVFVGNDVYANQLWIRDSESEVWTDAAMLNGCAYGAGGVKTASMGIAAGDFDRNGWLDFHVTNFQDESVSFYLNEGGLFQDRNIQFGLDGPSKSVLGFGTQAIDYDNNGTPDLVVANGHIEKAVAIKAPFQQPAQLFSNLGDHFAAIEVADDSGYWSQNHLGRGLACVDFDRDGRMDFVVTHLGEPSALLLNRTATPNHWLQMRLRGVVSERDAIGARVELSCGGKRLTDWVTAGNGFLSRNEAVVAFGLGDLDRVDELTITWPSGEIQTMRDLPVDHRLLVIEGQPESFELW